MNDRFPHNSEVFAVSFETELPSDCMGKILRTAFNGVDRSLPDDLNLLLSLLDKKHGSRAEA